MWSNILNIDEISFYQTSVKHNPSLNWLGLTHFGQVDLRKWAILTPYWRHQSLGYLKKIWMPVVNIHWCSWTLKGINI